MPFVENVARRLRYFPDRPLVEVTTRTLQGRFLLRPSPGLREIFVGILARAAALSPTTRSLSCRCPAGDTYRG